MNMLPMPVVSGLLLFSTAGGSRDRTFHLAKAYGKERKWNGNDSGSNTRQLRNSFVHYIHSGILDALRGWHTGTTTIATFILIPPHLGCYWRQFFHGFSADKREQISSRWKIALATTLVCIASLNIAYIPAGSIKGRIPVFTTLFGRSSQDNSMMLR